MSSVSSEQFEISSSDCESDSDDEVRGPSKRGRSESDSDEEVFRRPSEKSSLPLGFLDPLPIFEKSRGTAVIKKCRQWDESGSCLDSTKDNECSPERPAQPFSQNFAMGTSSHNSVGKSEYSIDTRSKNDIDCVETSAHASNMPRSSLSSSSPYSEKDRSPVNHTFGRPTKIIETINYRSQSKIDLTLMADKRGNVSKNERYYHEPSLSSKAIPEDILYSWKRSASANAGRTQQTSSITVPVAGPSQQHNGLIRQQAEAPPQQQQQAQALALKFTSTDNKLWYDARKTNPVIVEMTIAADIDAALQLTLGFQRLNWGPILQLENVYYPKLVREFYANITAKHTKGEPEVHSYVRGVHIHITKELLGTILGLESDTTVVQVINSCLYGDRDFVTVSIAARELGIPKVVNKGRSLYKVKLAPPRHHALIYLLAHNVSPKKKGYDSARFVDLYHCYRMIHGVSGGINLPAHILFQMKAMAASTDTKRALGFPRVLTKVFKHFNVPLSTLPGEALRTTQNHIFSEHTVIGLGMILRRGVWQSVPWSKNYGELDDRSESGKDYVKEEQHDDDNQQAEDDFQHNDDGGGNVGQEQQVGALRDDDADVHRRLDGIFALIHQLQIHIDENFQILGSNQQKIWQRITARAPPLPSPRYFNEPHQQEDNDPPH